MSPQSSALWLPPSTWVWSLTYFPWHRRLPYNHHCLSHNRLFIVSPPGLALRPVTDTYSGKKGSGLNHDLCVLGEEEWNADRVPICSHASARVTSQTQQIVPVLKTYSLWTCWENGRCVQLCVSRLYCDDLPARALPPFGHLRTFLNCKGLHAGACVCLALCR